MLIPFVSWGWGVTVQPRAGNVMKEKPFQHSTCGTDAADLTSCHHTGRDVSNGSYRIDAVRMAFQRASRRLEALAQGRRMDDMTVNYLQVGGATQNISQVLLHVMTGC